MPAVNSAGNTRIDQIDNPCEACVAAMPRTNLRRRVEAEPEQKAERIHLPALLDQPEEMAEKTPKKAAIGEHQVEIFFDERAALLDRPEGAVDRDHDDDVGERDGEQEERRNEDAVHAADRPERVGTTLQRVRRDGDDEGEPDDEGRMPSEKKRPTPIGRLPSCISLRVTLSMAAM